MSKELNKKQSSIHLTEVENQLFAQYFYFADNNHIEQDNHLCNNLPYINNIDDNILSQWQFC